MIYSTSRLVRELLFLKKKATNRQGFLDLANGCLQSPTKENIRCQAGQFVLASLVRRRRSQWP